MNAENEIEKLFQQSRIPDPDPALKNRILAACRAKEPPRRLIPLFVKYALAASWLLAVALQIAASRSEAPDTASGAPMVAAAVQAPDDSEIFNGLVGRFRAATNFSPENTGDWAGVWKGMRSLTKGEESYDI